MRAGERLLHKIPATIEPDVASDIEIIHEDAAIVVIGKPAPLPMHPCGRFNRNSLSYLLGELFHPLKLRPAHRLDADTSGVVVFTKTGQVARILQSQFESASVRKTYIAQVQGRPVQMSFECHLPINAEPGTNGIRLPDENGLPASTHFRVLEKFDDGTALLEVTPKTGRTNQIRAHLWKLDLPICGDPIYLPNQKLGINRSLSLNDPPLRLHAAEVEFIHPLTQELVRFKSPAPAWLARSVSC